MKKLNLEPLNMEPNNERKRICAECTKWEPGDFWGTGSGNHGVLVESKGWCLLKKNKRKRWNYCKACDGFDNAHRGFIYQGGDLSIEEDLANVMQLVDEMLSED